VVTRDAHGKFTSAGHSENGGAEQSTLDMFNESAGELASIETAWRANQLPAQLRGSSGRTPTGSLSGPDQVAAYRQRRARDAFCSLTSGVADSSMPSSICWDQAEGALGQKRHRCENGYLPLVKSIHRRKDLVPGNGLQDNRLCHPRFSESE